MVAPPSIILASTSPYRRALMERLGLRFTVVAPQVPETDLPGEAPDVRAWRLALAKARAVASQHPGALVIGSDQVASLAAHGGHTLLHKPGDREHCRAQLAALSGRSARFDTAAAVVHDGVEQVHVDLTRVQFRQLSALDIEHYMDREPAFDCAGGFKCEGLGVSLFEALESRDPTALVGLPLIWICAALRRRGVSV